MSQFEEEPILFDCLWQLIDEKKFPFMVASIGGAVRQCVIREVTSHSIGGRGQMELFIKTHISKTHTTDIPASDIFIIWNDEADDWTITKNARGEWWLERATD